MMTRGIETRFHRYDRALSVAVLILVLPLVLVEPAYAAQAPFWVVPALFHFYRRSERRVRVLGVALWMSIPVFVIGGFRYAGSENAFFRVPFDSRLLLQQIAVTAAVFLVGGAIVLMFGLLFGRRLTGGRVVGKEAQR